MCHAKSFSKRPSQNLAMLCYHIVKVERDWDLSRLTDFKTYRAPRVMPNSSEWLTSEFQQWLSALICLIISCRYLWCEIYLPSTTIRVGSICWSHPFLYFGWNFTCKDVLLSRLLSVFSCCCSAILANSNDTFHVNCACWRSRSANCGSLRENVAASLVPWLGSMNCLTAK